MTEDVHRDICPCGSRISVADCCGPAERALADNKETVARAVAWLREHHEIACDEAMVADFFGSLGSSALERLQELPDFVLELLQINGREWLLAEGVLTFANEERRALELVLGSRGPELDDTARQFLELLGERPLGLYQVVERLPDGGLLVRDLLASPALELRVVQTGVSSSLVEGKVFAARLLPFGTRFGLSGCVYPFPSETATPVRDRLRTALADEAGGRPPFARALASTLLIDAWLRGLVPPPRTLVDLDSGEPVLLVSDLYDVLDWDRLVVALTAQDDVEGDRKRGFSRHEPGDATRRARLLIDVVEPARRIEVLARTRGQADEGRDWLERIAGGALDFYGRTIVDPLPALQGAGVPLVAVGQSLPRDEKAAHLTRIYHYAFRHWADQPLSLLGGLTPREAAATDQGRAEVLELIARYEHEERDRAADEDRPAVGFAFLRDMLGLG